METVRFDELDLCQEILRGVKEMGFEEASPIQAQAIPVAMQGYDVIGQAQTGTGKTAAFGIPVLEKVNINKDIKHPQALILCPTRELAVQAANGTNSETDRQSIQDEISQLTTEIDRVAETTKFNETYLLKGDTKGTTKTNTLAAHDAGLAGKIGESKDGITKFTADKLAVGDKTTIGGVQYNLSLIHI